MLHLFFTCKPKIYIGQSQVMVILTRRFVSQHLKLDDDNLIYEDTTSAH